MVNINKTPTKTKTGTICTVAEVKKQLEIESGFTDDDTYIGTLIDVAVEMVESDTNADLQETTNVLEADIETLGLSTYYRINQAPMKSFTSIQKKVGGTYETISTGLYKIESYFNCIEIEFTGAVTGVITHLKFTFATGYSAADVPKKLKQAVILKTKDLYDTERGSYIEGTIVSNQNTYAALLSKHIRTYY